MHVHRCEEGARATGSLISLGDFHVPALPESLPVTVYLPPGYDSSDATYPLAIFFDGQNMFDDEGSHRGGWQLHRLLDYRACRRTRSCRRSDSHRGLVANGDPLAMGPRGHTRPRRSDTRMDHAVARSDPPLGTANHAGTRARAPRRRLARWTVVALRVFQAPGSLWQGRGIVTFTGGFWRASQDRSSVTSGKRPARAAASMLDAGERECECTSIMRHTGEMASLLSHKGYREGADLLRIADPDGAHDEVSWKRRLPVALQFLCE